MSAVGLESFEHTLQLTHIWINDLDSRLGWENKARTFRLLKVVLHALRDWIPVNEAADFGAQLPTLLRGAYYEQWRPAMTPAKVRDRAAFFARIDEAFRTDPLVTTDEAVATVFELLNDKITAGEVGDVRNALPKDIRALWPQPVAAPRRRAR
jgi:uncharacterized protein (DUF2267 family)